MTIEELKVMGMNTSAHYDRLHGALVDGLLPEILALVEAAEEARMADTTRRGIELILGDALDAFNAKLAAL